MCNIEHVCSCGSNNTNLISIDTKDLIFNSKPIEMIVLEWKCNDCNTTHIENYSTHETKDK